MKFILNLLLNFFDKGELEMMAILYASKILNESINNKTGMPWVFDDVAPKLKSQVADILINECNMPELVPAEYGGAA